MDDETTVRSMVDAEGATAVQGSLDNEGDGHSYVRKVAKNAGISAAGTIISQLFGPITGVITARALGIEAYGVYSLYTSWTGTIADFSRFGLAGDTMIRFLGSYKGEGRLDKAKGAILYATKLTVIVASILTVGLFLFAGPFATHVLKSAKDVDALRFFAPAVLLTALYGVVIASLTGLQAQRYVVLANSIGGNIANLVSLLLFLALGMKLYAALGSSLIQDLAILVLGLIFLFKVFPGLRKKELQPVLEKKELLTFSGTIFATSLFSKYTFRLDLLFLGWFGTAAQVGGYAVASKFQPLIYMPHYAVAQIFAPVIAELYVRRETQELERLYKTVTKWTSSLSLPIFATLVLFHVPILMIFGKDFRGAAIPLIVLGIGNSFADAFGMSGHVIVMTGRASLNLVNSIITMVVTISLFLLLIPKYGSVGAAVAFTVATVIVNIVRMAEVYYYFKIHPFKWTLLKIPAALLVGLGPVYGVRALDAHDVIPWRWVLELLLFWGTYCLATWLLRLDADDRVVVDALLGRLRKTLRRRKSAG